MNTIRILHEKVASQIAAGEVVERPGSVVRELIDNSIDAGADRIVIQIEKAGKGLIRVGDNGSGMSRDDILLSIERHATSKIETAEDLFCVKSLGFRGEALPSIASVSRTQITSRLHNQLTGYRLKITGGKLSSIEETGAPTGTVVEVRDLFFNIPARRKFLRSARTEISHIVDLLSRVALSFPEINFRLEDAGRILMHLPATDHKLPRLSALLGRDLAKSMIEVQHKNDDMGIKAYLAPSELSRNRGDRLFIYVNKRNIRDRLVTKAIMEGYGKRLMKGQYPQAVIFMEIDPSKVDVNVHPTKQEVRFHNSGPLFQLIASTIDNALSKRSYAFLGQKVAKNHESPDQDWEPPFVSEPYGSYSRIELDIAPRVETKVYEQSIATEVPQVIGQLGDTYILCQVRDGLLMVDQHAAHERVLYEILKKGFDTSRIEAQGLLIPHKLELSLKEKKTVLEKGERLSRLGIDLDHFGGTTFLLRSVPVILMNRTDWDLFVSELIAELEEGDLEQGSVLDKVLSLMACHGALRAGHRLTQEEMTRLIGQLEEMELPTNCPHGRPIFRHFTFREIEKMFKRIV
jgi:DNA mismatch repair protein MutL